MGRCRVPPVAASTDAKRTSVDVDRVVVDGLLVGSSETTPLLMLAVTGKQLLHGSKEVHHQTHGDPDWAILAGSVGQPARAQVFTAELRPFVGATCSRTRQCLASRARSSFCQHFTCSAR